MIFFVVLSCLFCFTKSQVPPQADDWDLENENPKYLNQTCKSNQDCYGSESMLCHNNKCNCKDNYEPGLRFVGRDGVQFVCVQAPLVYEPCTKICRKPAVCKLSANKTITYKLYSNQETTIEVNGKVCLCESPYKYEPISRTCNLECKGETEKYDDNSFKCVIDIEKKKSKSVNKVLVNGDLKPVVAIGEHCLEDTQCQNSFSECKNDVCICKENFTVVDGKCVTQMFNCPFGEVLKKNDKFVPCKNFRVAQNCSYCTLKSDENSPMVWSGDSGSIIPPGGLPMFLFDINREMSHDCPSGHFCSTIYGQADEDGSHGYCCPDAPMECPTGEPLTNVTCDPIHGDNDQQYCPKSHYCHYVLGNSFQPKLCCPLPCFSGFIYVQQKCYALANIGYNCEIDEQCQDSSQCIKGTCQSPDSINNIDQKLIQNCKKGEVPVGDQCLPPKAKLGESCKSDSTRCPRQAVCNKNFKCVCQTGAFPVGDECVRRISSDCRHDDFGDKSVATKPYKISVDEFLRNLTLCKIRNIKPSSILKNIVDKCPAGHYCGEYMESAGLCCPMSAPDCHEIEYYNRNIPLTNKTCDSEVETSCGDGYKCRAFKERYNLADRNSQEGTVCCPIWSKEALLND